MAFGCQRAHSPYAYRNADPEQLYATVCHGGKRTITIPAEEWPAHKAHGDYRGPCRARGMAGPALDNTPKRKHTPIAHRGNPARLAASRLAWERQQVMSDTLAAKKE